MGRTNPTYRDLLRRLEERWQPYRRGLRLRDQERFDRLFEDAAAHADAAGYLNPDEPLHPALVSMLIEQQARLEAVHLRLRALEDDVDPEALDGRRFDIDLPAPSGGPASPPE